MFRGKPSYSPNEIPHIPHTLQQHSHVQGGYLNFYHSMRMSLCVYDKNARERAPSRFLVNATDWPAPSASQEIILDIFDIVI